MSGVWLSSAPEEHRCRLPILWPFHVRTGDRWKCRCGAVWRVTVEPYNRVREWTREDKSTPDGRMKVFRPATEEQLWYWLNEELDLKDMEQKVCAADMLEALKKHFEIGSRV